MEPAVGFGWSLSLPYPARIRMNHGLPSMATKGVGKLRHVSHYVIHAIAVQRVPLRHHRGARGFWTVFSTPHIGVGEEEALQFGEAIVGGCVEILALHL